MLTATVTAVESVLLDGEPRRTFTLDDAPRLRADVLLLREYAAIWSHAMDQLPAPIPSPHRHAHTERAWCRYFIARDEHGVPHGLPEAPVLEETAYLDELVSLMHQPTEELVAMLMSKDKASTEGKPDAPIPEYDSAVPRHKCNLVRDCSQHCTWVCARARRTLPHPTSLHFGVPQARLLLHRARADPAAERFIDVHREALRDMLARERKARPSEPKHGRLIGQLRASRESELAEGAHASSRSEESSETGALVNSPDVAIIYPPEDTAPAAGAKAKSAARGMTGVFKGAFQARRPSATERTSSAVRMTPNGS